jgi:hypothetical protein
MPSSAEDAANDDDVDKACESGEEKGVVSRGLSFHSLFFKSIGEVLR